MKNSLVMAVQFSESIQISSGVEEMAQNVQVDQKMISERQTEEQKSKTNFRITVRNMNLLNIFAFVCQSDTLLLLIVFVVIKSLQFLYSFFCAAVPHNDLSIVASCTHQRNHKQKVATRQKLP